MLALFARARTHMQQPAKKSIRRKDIILKGLPRHIPTPPFRPPPSTLLYIRVQPYTYSRKQGLPPPPPRGEVERFIGCRFMPERVAIQGYKRGKKGSWKRSGVGSLLSFLSGKVTLEKGGKGLAGGNSPGKKGREERGCCYGGGRSRSLLLLPCGESRRLWSDFGGRRRGKSTFTQPRAKLPDAR